jgi:predicted SAM-dependent methyltransferase
MKLNFGAGKDIKKEGWDNIDMQDFDFNKFPYPIKDNTYDYILASHVLEHLDNWIEAFNELCRIAKPGAIIEVRVPFYNCGNAYYPTHKHYFTPAAFDIWINPPYEQDRRITKGYRVRMRSRNYNILGLIFHNICHEIIYELEVIK